MDEVMEWIEENKDAELTSELYEIEFTAFDRKIEYQKAAKDLWAVMTTKCKGEAKDKFKHLEMTKGRNYKNGIEAYRVVHDWFTETTAMNISQMRTRVMMPNEIKKESEVLAAIEKWDQEMGMIDRVDTSYPLPPMYRLAAIKRIIGGIARIKGHIEMKEVEMRGESIRCAILGPHLDSGEEGNETFKNSILNFKPT